MLKQGATKMAQKPEGKQRSDKRIWQRNTTRQIKTRISEVGQEIKGRYDHAKHWRGFGALSALYIASWIYLFIVWYNPWQKNVALGGDGQLPLAEGIAMFLFLVPGLIILPGALYVVWIKLLRKPDQ
jgi:hypothetical protein